MLAQHYSITDKHYPPKPVIEGVREVFYKYFNSYFAYTLLDPASDSLANRLVQASHYFTEKDDGLPQCWVIANAVWLNAPGGKIGNKSLQKLFIEKFLSEFSEDNFEVGSMLLFNLERLNDTEIYYHASCVMHFPKRLRFWSTFWGDELREGQWSKTTFDYTNAGVFPYSAPVPLKEGETMYQLYSPSETKHYLAKHNHLGEIEEVYKWTNSPTHASAIAWFGVEPHLVRAVFGDDVRLSRGCFV